MKTESHTRESSGAAVGFTKCMWETTNLYAYHYCQVPTYALPHISWNTSNSMTSCRHGHTDICNWGVKFFPSALLQAKTLPARYQSPIKIPHT